MPTSRRGQIERRGQPWVLLASAVGCLLGYVALATRDALQAEGIGAAVVSAPCLELFDAQDAAYKASVLGKGGLRVAIEAASPMGWDRFIAPDGVFVGMRSFGASAPAEALYEHFGITPAGVVDAVKARL